MIAQPLWNVFADAAAPQKVVLIVLCAALPATLVLTALALKSQGNVSRSIVAELRVAGPALGLLTGGLNGFHMGDTLQKLPFNPTLKQLAPGIFEVSTLVSLGALVGIVAVVAHLAICLRASGPRTS